MQIRSRASASAQWVVGVVALASCAAFAQTTPTPSETGPAPAQAAPQKEGARIEMDQLEVDLGQLVKGESAEALFTIHNGGDETLRILRAKPG